MAAVDCAWKEEEGGVGDYGVKRGGGVRTGQRGGAHLAGSGALTPWMEDGSPEFGDNRQALPICESIEEGGGVGLLLA